MKTFLILILILSFFACSKPQKKEAKQVIIQYPEKIDALIQRKKQQNIKKEITFSDTNGVAALIGEKIELLDTNLDFVEDISNLSGKIVKIKGKSDSLFYDDQTYGRGCFSFWYVKIQYDTINGVVDGEQVFKIQPSEQDTSFTIDSNKIDILTTYIVGGPNIEVGCPRFNRPILIRDKKNNYFGLVELIKNEYSKDAMGDDDFPFFQLRVDDACYDKIDSITADETGIRLKIYRRWQEGWNDFDVLLTYEDGKYKAKYLNYGEVK